MDRFVATVTSVLAGLLFSFFPAFGADLSSTDLSALNQSRKITLIHMGDIHGHLVAQPNLRSDSSGEQRRHEDVAWNKENQEDSHEIADIHHEQDHGCHHRVADGGNQVPRRFLKMHPHRDPLVRCRLDGPLIVFPPICSGFPVRLLLFSSASDCATESRD